MRSSTRSRSVLPSGLSALSSTHSMAGSLTRPSRAKCNSGAFCLGSHPIAICRRQAARPHHREGLPRRRPQVRPDRPPALSARARSKFENRALQVRCRKRGRRPPCGSSCRLRRYMYRLRRRGSLRPRRPEFARQDRWQCCGRRMPICRCRSRSLRCPLIERHRLRARHGPSRRLEPIRNPATLVEANNRIGLDGSNLVAPIPIEHQQNRDARLTSRFSCWIRSRGRSQPAARAREGLWLEPASPPQGAQMSMVRRCVREQRARAMALARVRRLASWQLAAFRPAPPP